MSTKGPIQDIHNNMWDIEVRGLLMQNSHSTKHSWWPEAKSYTI